MEIVILSVQRDDADRWVAELSLNGAPGQSIVEFYPGSSEIRNHVPESRIDGTREAKEIASLLVGLREGKGISFPHRVNVKDRWPSWPSTDEPQSSTSPYQSRDVVLLNVLETSPGMWTAELSVNGQAERLVIQLPERHGRRIYQELSARLSTTKELDALYRTVVRASRGERLTYPLKISVSHL